MSCYNNCYLPEPPRAWSRVQNNCSLIIDATNSGLVKLPYSNKIIPVSSLGQELAMLNKGNVLQYKANSSNLTKAQRYSKIAQGQWVNRNTTWATQSTSGFTNPNTTSLKRSGNVVNIAIDPITGAIIGPTTAPPTCPQTIIPNNGGLPSNGGGGSDVDDPNIPPPVEPTPGSNTFPVIIPDTPVEPIVIQDGGILICSVQENVCTGETKSSLSQQLCNPTTDSDVPGTIQDLCWNDGTPTWYPRSRYVMTNSTNKWPVNATLVSAIRPPPPPFLSINIINNCSNAILSWTETLPCNLIYQIYDTTLGLIGTTTSTSYQVALSNCTYYSFYVVALLGAFSSAPSNTVSAEGVVTYTITSLVNTSYTVYSNNGYTGIVFDNNNSTTFTTGTAIINFCKNVNASILIVGGGGGGGAGDSEEFLLTPGGGTGGGGGAITYLTNYTISGSTNINLTIGFGGEGKSPGNGGQGNLTGQSGTASLFSTISSGGGSGGTGIGGSGAPPAGSSNSSSGGGGGGAGGGSRFVVGGVNNGGDGGSGLSGVNPGVNGSDGSGTSGGTSGGNGGASGIPTVTLPFTPSPITLNLGGGGGGGGSVSGGGAGNGSGGSAGTNVLGNYYGDSALYGISNSAYGGGGGGGGIEVYTSGNTNIGGNGGNGTVMIWWPACQN